MRGVIELRQIVVDITPAGVTSEILTPVDQGSVSIIRNNNIFRLEVTMKKTGYTLTKALPGYLIKERRDTWHHFAIYPPVVITHPISLMVLLDSPATLGLIEGPALIRKLDLLFRLKGYGSKERWLSCSSKLLKTSILLTSVSRHPGW